ncbi:MAG: hypothetical protein N3A38_11310 [Planctomycetota bacterium]|nr:hypothetical protein [Planctomycetota bacterium]
MIKRRLGDLLQAEGLVNEEQLRKGIEEQRKKNCLLAEALVGLGIITEEQLAQVLVKHFGAPYISPAQYDADKEVSRVFPERVMREYQLAPLDRIGNILIVAAAGLLDQDIMDELERLSGCRIQLFVGTQSDVKRAIDERFKEEAGRKEELSELGSLLLEAEQEIKQARPASGAETRVVAPAAVAEPGEAAISPAAVQPAGAAGDVPAEEAPVPGASPIAAAPRATGRVAVRPAGAKADAKPKAGTAAERPRPVVPADSPAVPVPAPAGLADDGPLEGGVGGAHPRPSGAIPGGSKLLSSLLGRNLASKRTQGPAPPAKDDGEAKK